MPGLVDWTVDDTRTEDWAVLYPFNCCTARDWGSLNDKQLLQGRWVPLQPQPSPWSVTEQQFARLSNTDRFVYVVGVAARRLPRDAGAALLELIEPRNIAIMSGMLAFIVGAHFIGVGVFVDIALVGATAVVLGKEGVEGLVRLKSAIEETLRADCYLALDSAGLTLSEAALKLSVATLTAILLKRAIVQPRYSGPVAPRRHQGGPVNGNRPVPVHSTGKADQVTVGVNKVLPGFSATESGIINEAKGILNSKELAQIRAAHAAGRPATVNVGGRLIQYEPGLPASGMTMFGENGFLIGREAFSSPQELQQTILHELHRLATSNSANGVSGALAAQETKAAADFAAKALKEIK